MVSIGSLVFKEHLERLSEVVLVLLVGGSLFLDSWSWEAVAMALFLFVVARPLSVLLVLWAANMPLRTQGMIGWFGVRGIGSLYYLMYAIQHGLPEALALQLIQMTLIVVTLSILVHGISVKPLMAAVWRRTGNHPPTMNDLPTPAPPHPPDTTGGRCCRRRAGVAAARRVAARCAGSTAPSTCRWTCAASRCRCWR